MSEVSQAEVEEWRPIPGYEGLYSVSSLGRVRTEARVRVGPRGKNYVIPPRIRKTPVNKYGYPHVSLHRDGAQRTRLVHHLVLIAFKGPRPPGLLCCHGDGNPGNARLWNLRWDTPAANSADSIKHGVCPRGEKASKARLTEKQVLKIRGDKRRQTVIAKEYGVDPSHISRIKSGDVWTHLQEANHV